MWYERSVGDRARESSEQGSRRNFTKHVEYQLYHMGGHYAPG